MKNNIKKLRQERGLSQRQVADDLEIPIRSYIRYEKGQTDNLQFFCKIAEYLMVDINDLIDGEESMENNNANSNNEFE
ncbi:helix-turn-helix transcriptional regulator [Pseudobutyrivibrio sp. LB2011]|uniref:helix-turn-helix transcriptional regulator n=1 Tax=Pseudobutyrivibrio sp. LB2011 TaxID=1408312 RepID=UPI0005D28557|nr:helix-turn-helix transcriptional regulator [Pseudobutyrivibrio sp. LB2011]